MPRARHVELLAIGLGGVGVWIVLALALPSIGSSIGRRLGWPVSLPLAAVPARPTPAAPDPDPWAAAVAQAMQATALAQTAQTSAAWNAVAQAWLAAIAHLQRLAIADPRYFFAQKKLKEYLRNFLYAQQQAMGRNLPLAYPSFGSQRLDAQLTLYLSYVATLGPPDVLIVGSSRALQGIDPNVLQQGLAAQGMSHIQVFNLGIHGATAQVVDVLLRQILPPETLPRLILWADGVRAFNSGRRDRTYEGLVRSPGYQQVLSGHPPRLKPPEAEGTSETGSVVREVRQSRWVQNTCGMGILPTDQTTATAVSGWVGDSGEMPKGQLVACTDCGPIAQIMPPNAAPPLHLAGEPSDIDALGFLAVSRRFEPITYFRQYPRVSGLYDGDYAAFSLGGRQAAAFDRILTLSRDRQIPLVLVNLPLTDIYLDAMRSRAEQQFIQTWQARAQRDGFAFRDYGRRWPQNYAFFDDPSHLNQWGAAAIAQLLAQDRSLPWPQTPTSGKEKREERKEKIVREKR